MISEFEMKINRDVSYDRLIEEYHRLEEYLQCLPCGCDPNVRYSRGNQCLTMNMIHRNLYDYLNKSSINLRMNHLDEKRRKKI